MLFKKKNKRIAVVEKRSYDSSPFMIPAIIEDEETSNDIIVSALNGHKVTNIFNNNKVSKVSKDAYKDYFADSEASNDFSNFPKTHLNEIKENKIVDVKPQIEEPKVVEEHIDIESKPIYNEDPIAEVNENNNQEISESVFDSLFGHDKSKDFIKEYERDTLNDSYHETYSEEEYESSPHEYVDPREVDHLPFEEIKESRIEEYNYPILDLLDPLDNSYKEDDEWNQENIEILNRTMHDYKIDGLVASSTTGPTFTRYSIDLGPGVPGKKIEQHHQDLQRALSATSIRIENPVRGTRFVGIEVPNKNRRIVQVREVLETEEFLNSKKPLTIPVGLDAEGKVFYTSIPELPHGLVAGSSGSGKSVYLITLITSLLFKNSPDDLRLLLVDPKKTDLSKFTGIPHLLCPILIDPKEAYLSFKWLYDEMERRLDIFNKNGLLSDLAEYNEKRKTNPELEHIPYIVCIIEEAADLLSNGGNEMQDILQKLVQKARSSGIHILLCMQKPVAKVLSTAIKSNTSGRFAFYVQESTDSIVMINKLGAEQLLKKGDMIFSLAGDLIRLQSAFMNSGEIQRLKDHIKIGEPEYLFTPEELVVQQSNTQTSFKFRSDLFEPVARFVAKEGKCVQYQIQRVFHINFNTSADIINALERYGIVGPNVGKKARDVNFNEITIEEKLNELR